MAKMTLKPNIKILFLALTIPFQGGVLYSASLEMGHVRANNRGWVAQDFDTTDGSSEVKAEEATFEENERTVVSSEPVVTGDASEIRELVASPRARDPLQRAKSLLFVGKKVKEPTLRDGYLAFAAPPSLRFSDLDPEHSRPPSPALPEFNMVSNEYLPYLIESALPEDAMRDNAMLSEIVIELERHNVISGKIDTRRVVKEELVEHFDLDEQRTTVLRPEEVLIYFETDTNVGRAGTMVPFSPATPNTPQSVKSSANLKKE